jgi:hypothetical protein
MGMMIYEYSFPREDERAGEAYGGTAAAPSHHGALVLGNWAGAENRGDRV